MLKRLWRKIVGRQRRVNAELEYVELEMIREEAESALSAFPQKPYKASTIVLFTLFGFFVAVAAGLSCAELLTSLFR